VINLQFLLTTAAVSRLADMITVQFVITESEAAVTCDLRYVRLQTAVMLDVLWHCN
jgi:hypothetical protein